MPKGHSELYPSAKSVSRTMSVLLNQITVLFLFCIVFGSSGADGYKLDLGPDYMGRPQSFGIRMRDESKEGLPKRFLSLGWGPGGSDGTAEEKKSMAICQLAAKNNLLMAPEICNRPQRRYYS